MCRGRRARIRLHLHIQREKIVLRGSRAGRRSGCRNHPSCVYVPIWSAFWLQKPSILRVCVREEDAGEREAGVHSTTPTYTAGKDSPAREPSWSAFWLQKPSVLRVCVREEDAGGGKAGAHSTTPTYTTGKDPNNGSFPMKFQSIESVPRT
jgi:hypothetical protein